MTESPELAALRIVDACANRAAEGLRTMEEFARFVLEDRHLCQVAKQLRHDLRSAMETIPLPARLVARAVRSDCGTTINTVAELERMDTLAVVGAAAGRTHEALRCIEEYGKTIVAFDSPGIEAIRYQSYTLAATLLLNQNRVSRLTNAKLYLLLGTEADTESFANHVEALYAAGVDLIQLRDKQANDRRLYECAKVAADIARRLGKWFIVNDRADIAAAVHASGVHLGQDELPVEAARRVVGGEQLIGVSTHSIEQARAAVLDGADYLGCGPTFPSQTKSFSQFPGLGFLREVAAEITLPTFAISGIDENNLKEVMQTGIHGVAISSAILNAPDQMAAAQRLRRVMISTLCLLTMFFACAMPLQAEDIRAIEIQSKKINESSGLAASNRVAGHFWTHNDSGDGPKLYAINEQGQVTGSVVLDGVKSIDWEDMASFLDGESSRLIVADIGDNQAKRETLTLYLLNEPDPLVHTRTTTFDAITVRFPDGPRDCEAIGVDTKRRLIWMVAKSLLPMTPVYSLALSDLTTRDGSLRPVTLVRRGTVAATFVSAMDLDPRSGDVVLVNYFQCLRFSSKDGDNVGDWMLRTPQISELPKLKQIEAVAFDANGVVWVTSEGVLKK